ncbi:hypothetical protein ACFXCZ_04695 [Streptomyces sp. NPDC059396]|uniref:hypothetical protein n=1 Tax=Streptomyces sp. NPDC059396 TaxID=3346819 RepID=UPI0036CE8001
MISFPDSSQVLADLGTKVTAGLVRAVDLAADDLQTYRETYPSWVAQHSERGLANWIHDRLWAHLIAELDGHPGVTLTDGEPTRELTVGVGYRLRVKRHRGDGQVSSYATQTALEFFAQGAQEAFPGFEEVRLTAGYEWNPDARKIGEAVLSLRDGQEDLVWLVPLRSAGEGSATGIVQPVQPATPTPQLPSINVPASGQRESTKDR